VIANFAMGAIIKITCLLIAGLVLDGLMRRKWVLATAAMWNGVLVAMALLPPAMLLVPQWVLPAVAPGSREIYPASDVARLTSAGTPDEAAEPSIDDRGNGAEVANSIPAPKIHDNRPTSSDKVSETLSTQSVSFLATANTVLGWLAPLYFLGVATAFVRLLNSWRTINLMRQQASTVTRRAWLERFEFWQTRLGLTVTRHGRQATNSALRSTIWLLGSDEIDVPVALGVRNRVILIPSRMLANAPTTDIDAILLHEMAHFARFDCEWQWVQKAVEAILWFHPLSWIARGRISFIRERACDDFAFHAIGDREAYTKTLLDVATGLARRRALGLGLTILRPGNLARRLEALQQSEGCSRCSASRDLRRAVVVAAICCTALLASLSMGRVEARNPVEIAAIAADPGAANTQDSNQSAKPTTEKPQPAPEIDEIRQLKASLDRIKVIAWTARERTDITRTPLNAKCGNEKWMQVSRDGDKWAALTKETGEILSDGKPKEFEVSRVRVRRQTRDSN
jgi:BlaR1 peptidase M56